jgi:glycosyltransferase involved in cell wall biosynthesis
VRLRPTLKSLRSLVAALKRLVKFERLYSEPLPPDFNGALYLQLNPDVQNAGAEPELHYARFGRKEGRLYSLPPLDVTGDHLVRQDRQMVLIVSHEASRTGAPILSLNLVQGFLERYNVVALLLGGGPLTESFRAAGATVISAHDLRGRPGAANIVIGQVCERFSFEFAVINSIESRVVLEPLSQNFVPTVSLIHEFASYTRPRSAFREALLWSNEVVFSAAVTKDNAFAEYPELSTRNAHIFPQGQCLLPSDGCTGEQHLAESARIRNLIRPRDAEKSFVILGAGFVQLRKGVDLFIDCAARVRRREGGNRCRFVWIGKGYDPENDVAYSVYLSDQIRRAGLEDYVYLLEETSAIETAYDTADLLLLSSRLDPLPNVAIDAMIHGVPVVCFDKTTGIADFLTESGLHEHCVATYVDTGDAADKILAFANSTSLASEIANASRAAATAFFKMDRYVAQIEELARAAITQCRQEKHDIDVILNANVYRSDFSNPDHNRSATLPCQVRGYVRSWATGIGRRQPFPGFHPGIYREHHDIPASFTDPLADYLLAGRPEGPWNLSVIEPNLLAAKSVPNNISVALHIHAYYPDLLPEILEHLSYNTVLPDLFVSTTNQVDFEEIADLLKTYSGRVVEIRIVPNKGRDIGPLLTAFGAQLINQYEYVGHLHTKKSADVLDKSMGKTWFRFLLENLLGGKAGAMADRILSQMKLDDTIGMVFPDDPHVVGFGANRAYVDLFAERLGIFALPEFFSFPVGTMFWARAAALKPMVDLNLGWEDYPGEPLPYDGSMLHTLERLFSMSLPPAGLRHVVTNVQNVTR